MELDEFKQAWQVLGDRLQRQEAIQWQLLRDRKLDHLRRGLRPLVWGQVLQLLLGIGLVLLGVACWTQNRDVPGLLASGLLVHAFGVVTIALAGMTIGMVSSIDPAAPVLKIQKQMARLRCVYRVNAYACGAPWWVMWVLVVVAFAGLSDAQPEAQASAATPAWILWSLAIGVAGLLATYTWAWHQYRRARAGGEDVLESAAIRRGQGLLDEIAAFERD